MPNNFENTPYAGQSHGLDMNFFHHRLYTKFAAKCDHDLHASNIDPASDILSCKDDYLCQTILKFHHGRQSYGPETNMFHRGLCPKFNCEV